MIMMLFFLKCQMSKLLLVCFFNWNDNNQIAVLDIFNCDANDKCTGTGVPMANGPFPNAKARFSAGLACTAGFVSTKKDEPLAIDIASDVLGQSSDKPKESNCVTPYRARTKTKPTGS